MAERPMPETSSLDAMYPSNSLISRQQNQMAVRDPEIKGGVTREKTSVAKKIEHQFFKSTIKDATSYVVKQVLLPSAVRMVKDMLHKFVDAMMNDGGSSSSYSRDGLSSPYVSYRDYYDDRGGSRNYARSERYDIGEIKCASEEDAKNLIIFLRRRIENGGCVQVGTLLDKCSLKTDSNDFCWGWYSMEGASWYKRGDGWYLDLPPAERVRG